MTFHPSLQTVCDELLEEDVLLSQQTESADAVRTPSVFLAEIGTVQFSRGGYWCVKFNFCMSDWVQIKRPRTAFALFAAVMRDMRCDWSKF
eukprot:s6567_g5.t1